MISKQPTLDSIATAPHSWLSKAAKVFILGAIGVLLYIAHAAFIPVALALLFGLVLSGPVEALHKKRVPRSLSAALILVLVLAAMAGVIAGMWTPTQAWYAKAPQTMEAIKKKVRPVARVVSSVDKLRENASTITAARAAKPAAVVAETDGADLIFDTTLPALTAFVTFVIVTLFLLAGGPPMLARMCAAFFHDLNSSHILHIMERVRSEVGHFYVVTTLINICLGTATGLAMWAWGMPSPYLWGALAAIINYIPYAGAATTLAVITFVAAVSFDTLAKVLGVAGTYVILATIEGQIAQPLLVGRRLKVNPLLIFLGLWFGGLFWGVAGIILATPLLVTLKVIAENSKSGKPMMEFLGPNKQVSDRKSQLSKLVRRLG